MLKTIAAAVGLVALAVPATAGAKDIRGAKLCGPSGCTTLTDRSLIAPIVEGGGQPQPVAPAAVGPYYRITFLIAEPGHGVVDAWSTWWSPTSAKLRGTSESGAPFWFALTDAQQRYLREGTKKLRAYPAPRLTRVEIGTRTARDPNSYFALLTTGWPAQTDYAVDWLPVTVTATRTNPWTDGVMLLYSPKTNSLWRANERLHVSDRVAANVEARRSLAAGGAGSSYAWAWVAGAVAIAGLAGGVFRRRR